MTNAKGDVEYINERWFVYTGQAPGTYCRETWTDVVHPDDLGKVIKVHQEALKKRETMEFEYRIRRHDGEYRWHLARTVFMRDKTIETERRFGTATDIHDQKTAEAGLAAAQSELKNSRNQLDFILQSVGSGVIAYDQNGKLIFANDQAAALAGYLNSKEFLGATPALVFKNLQMFHEDNTPFNVEELPSRLALNGIIAPPEKTVRYKTHSNQALRWLLLRAKAILDESGKISMVVSVIKDITEQKLAEIERQNFHEEAVISRNRLQAVIEHVDAGVMIVSAEDQSAIYVNDKFRDIWRYGSIPADFYARSEKLEAFYPDGKSLTTNDWPSVRTLTQGVTVKNEEIETVRGDGTRGFQRVSSSPIYGNENKIVAAVVTIQDITEIQKQGQIARFLDEASQIFSSSLDYHETLKMVTQLAVPRLGDWCSIAIVETATATIYAVAHQDPEMLKLSEEFRNNYPTDWSGSEGSAKVFRTGQSALHPVITDSMLTAQAKDQRHLELITALNIRSAITVPIRSHSRIFGVLNLISSDPARTYNENDLRTAEELGTRAGQAIENAKLYEQAQNAITSRDSLISVSAHELLTPVSGSKLQMQLMRKRLANGIEITPALLTKMIDQTERQLDRLSRLVNEMLDLSRINLGKLTIDRSRINLSALIADISERTTSLLEAAGCKLTTEIESDITGDFDSYRLEQVLSNLLSNAARYARGSKVTVKLRQETKDTVCLSVEDEGIGVKKEDQERIFQRFERAATIDEGSGLGLGLFVIKQIVEAHGGSVALQSTFGEGAEFSVRLPLCSGAPS